MDFRLCQGLAPGTLMRFMAKMHIIYNVAGAIFVVSRDRHLEVESTKLATSRQLCHSCLRHIPHCSRSHTRGPTHCTYDVSRRPSQPGSSSSVELSQHLVLKLEDHPCPPPPCHSPAPRAVLCNRSCVTSPPWSLSLVAEEPSGARAA